MKSLCTIVQTILLTSNVARLVSKKDYATLMGRTEEEGFTFWTSTLPSLGKALRLGLETGKLEPVTGFEWRNGRPTLFRGLFSTVFDSEGNYRPSSRSADSVQCILQATLLFYKTETPITDDKKLKAWESFVETQEGLPLVKRVIFRDVLALARHLIFQVIHELTYDDLLTLNFKMSSGAVQEKVDGQERWENTQKLSYPSSFDDCFPMDHYLYYNVNHMVEEMENWGIVDPSDTSVARITFVPKDSRGERTIACESAIRQGVKLGLMDLLQSRIEASPLTHKRIPLRDQPIMQDLSYWGSLYGVVATLDLRKASDTVTMWHIDQLFPKSWSVILQQLRSSIGVFERTEIVDGRKVTVHESCEIHSAFPMGSAVCFPVESLIFWSISSAASILSGGVHSYVFGDDTIVPAAQSAAVVEALSDAGFLVNEDKSYSAGPFRESCGGDYYLGVDVKVHSFKKVPGISPDTESGCRSSAIAFLNNIFARTGYCHSLVVAVEGLFSRPFVVSEFGPEVIGPERASNNFFYKITYNRSKRWKRKYRFGTKDQDPLFRTDGGCQFYEIRLPVSAKETVERPQYEPGHRLLWKYFVQLPKSKDVRFPGMAHLDVSERKSVTAYTSPRETTGWAWRFYRY